MRGWCNIPRHDEAFRINICVVRDSVEKWVLNISSGMVRCMPCLKGSRFWRKKVQPAHHTINPTTNDRMQQRRREWERNVFVQWRLGIWQLLGQEEDLCSLASDDNKMEHQQHQVVKSSAVMALGISWDIPQRKHICEFCLIWEPESNWIYGCTCF